MGTKRRRHGRHRRAEVHPDTMAILTDREPDNPFWRFRTDDELLAAWGAAGAEILAAWIADSPGTRPSFWWRFDAPRQPKGTFPGCFYDGQLPEPRRRIGGTGTPKFEVLNYAPSYHHGIPDSWVSRCEVDYYGGRFAGVPIDPLNPPAFEAQAAYLDRHDLLLPGEKKRLRKCDWRPEIIKPEDDETGPTHPAPRRSVHIGAHPPTFGGQ